MVGLYLDRGVLLERVRDEVGVMAILYFIYCSMRSERELILSFLSLNVL